MKKTLVLAALFAAAFCAANADPRDDALSAMLRCSGLTDRNARLGCYDATISRAPGALNQPVRAVPPAAGAPLAYTPVPPPAAPVAPRQRSEGMFDGILGTGGPARIPQTSVAQFGSESIANAGARAYPVAISGDAIDQISARVIAYSFDAGLVIVNLDNGQVWRQTPAPIRWVICPSRRCPMWR